MAKVAAIVAGAAYEMTPIVVPLPLWWVGMLPTEPAVPESAIELVKGTKTFLIASKARTTDVRFWHLADIEAGARAFPTCCGHLGWLGAERDPPSGIFLIPLGMPWTLFIGSVGKFDPFGGVSPAVLAMPAPAINLAILFSSALRRRRFLSTR